MAMMKASPPLTLTLRRSRIASVVIVAAYCATAILIAVSPIPAVLRTVGALCVVGLGTWVLLAALESQDGVEISVGLDRCIRVTRRRRIAEQGTILGDTYVGAWLTTIVWQRGTTRLPRAILVVRDSVEGEAFRRLRVVLRYSSPRPTADAMSGVEQG